MSKNIFIVCLIVVFFINISSVNLIIDNTYLGWLTNITYTIGILFLLSSTYKKSNKTEWLYVSFMILGLIFHAIIIENEKFTIIDSIKWIFLVIIIMASKKYSTPRLLFYLLIAFFISHCLIAIIEFKTQVNLIDYFYVERFSEISNKSEFRAFSLMEHPLYSANVTIIIMSFLMINKNINWIFKSSLLTLGSLALLSFNSRVSIIIWICLLVYKYLFYNLKSIYIILIGILVYFIFLSDIVYLIQQNSSFFGRLAVKDNLTDSSSMTRLMSYFFFWNERWDFQDIIFGGRIIYMPGTEASLENGILLSISWWGWIVGLAKVVLELIISYKCLKIYNIKDKWMIMIACWGTAFSNNNSMNTFVFTFFIISFLSIESKKKIKKYYKSEKFNITY